MDSLERLTKKFILVNMDDAEISTDDKHIIGTHALATCTGLLLYCRERKVAIVAHIGTDIDKTINKILDLLENNNIKFTNIEYRVIQGYYGRDENFINTIIYKLKFGNVYRMLSNHFTPYGSTKRQRNDIEIDYNTLSKQFAFDALSGVFVTDKVLFGTYYYIVNPQNDTLDKNEKKRI
ncbi:MAG: hypothetical protein IJE89_04215 [Bacilli bacterium]|nr:hypothetical protein [Bacilli bacterium]